MRKPPIAANALHESNVVQEIVNDTSIVSFVSTVKW